MAQSCDDMCFLFNMENWLEKFTHNTTTKNSCFKCLCLFGVSLSRSQIDDVASGYEFKNQTSRGGHYPWLVSCFNWQSKRPARELIRVCYWNWRGPWPANILNSMNHVRSISFKRPPKWLVPPASIDWWRFFQKMLNTFLFFRLFNR